MPARVNDTPSSRFELPALDLNFGSITDGTDIPPPPDSPVQKEPTPPQTPRLDAKANKQVKSVTKAAPLTAGKQATSNGNLAGTKRPADDVPPSPTASARPGKGIQSNGNGSVAASVSRPISRGGNSILDDRKSKRSSGWFKRLTGDNTARRSSLMFEEGSSSPTTQTRPSGPPPPMIPELKEFEKEDNGFGSDLFKNIK
ncbi:hypothetical protein NLU13_0361 [Sarocladium strictum]|uniref:Uncharacterized protein n=1 Tax=Sarocladium strictum TaxID=5046 RepID=A0AA39LB75_SARSR|nr:hypothetical protein NLU13_0361 [Sarocladium strictum]